MSEVEKLTRRVKRLHWLMHEKDRSIQRLEQKLHDNRKGYQQLRRENVKLRELARRFGEYVSQDRCEGCVMKRRCNNGDVEECWQRTEIRALANELGIEVE